MTEPVALTSQALLAAGFVHGFFTRIGGCSTGNYASLNCSYSVGDSAEHVTANLARVEKSLGLDRDHLVTVSQVHGSAVEWFEPNELPSAFKSRQADALLGRSVAFGLAVRTADCVPVLVGCPVTGYAAAIHAGWRGIVSNVIGRAIGSLIDSGCDPADLVACVGPHIGVSAFEVSEEVASLLDAVAPEVGATERSNHTKPHVSLGRLAMAQLLKMGVSSGSVECLDACTYSNPQDFFSFRRDGSVSGRQLSVIRPRD
jgi:YfiH family protein